MLFMATEYSTTRPLAHVCDALFPRFPKAWAINEGAMRRRADKGEQIEKKTKKRDNAKNKILFFRGLLTKMVVPETIQ